MSRSWPWQDPAPDSELAEELRLGRPRWLSFFHLGWSVWVFVMPLLSAGGHGFTLPWLLLTLASYPLFLWLYVVNVTAAPRPARQAAIGMLLLCLALLPWYPSGLTYFVYGGLGLHPRGGHLGRHLLLLLILSGVLMAVASWMGYPWQALLFVPIILVVVGTLIAVDQSNRKRDLALQLSHEEVRRLAALAERERIGRDLHDLLGHTLSMVALKSDLAARLVGDDAAAARAEMRALGEIARGALAEVRRAVSGIRAAGIAAELAAARLLLDASGVRLECRLAPAVAEGALRPDAENALALALREAITNVQRHARARRVALSLAAETGGLRLVVEDDGRGGSVVPGTGLAGMRERLEAAGGHLRVGAAPAGGLRIEAWVPFTAAEPPGASCGAAIGDEGPAVQQRLRDGASIEESGGSSFRSLIGSGR